MPTRSKPLVSAAVIRDKFEGSGYATEQDFIEARLRFREAARAQRVCQNPDCRRPTAAWDPHHVVYEQELRRRGLPIYDPRNALRVCRRCHQNHHHMQPLPQIALTTSHLTYAKEALGEFHIDYLNRRYLPECPI